jgi:hypothetical protein
VPWRPRDIEQRDGRILRQGNQNAEVELIRYATEKSFDAYMWQANERKAKFIGQLLRGKLDVREIEDVGETALSYGEIKALAAGDPLLLEKAQVDAELVRLRRLERAHDRSQDRLRGQVLGSADTKTELQRDVDVLTAALRRRSPTAGDAFRMYVGAAVFDKRPGVGEALRQRLAALARDLGHQRETVVPIGTLAGLPIEACATRRSSGIDLTVRCGVPHTDVEMTVESLQDDGKATGLVTRLENRINALERRRDELVDEIARLDLEMARAQARIGTEFPQAGDLSAAQLRAADIQARLAEAATYQPPAADPNDSPAQSADVEAEPEHEPP